MKMKYIDILVTVLFVVALAVIAFFWKCGLDVWIVILAVAIVVGAALVKYFQYKKLKELGVDEEEKQE